MRRRIADLTFSRYSALNVLEARTFNRIAGGSWKGAGDLIFAAEVVRALLKAGYAANPGRGHRVEITDAGRQWLRENLT